MKLSKTPSKIKLLQIFVAGKISLPNFLISRPFRNFETFMPTYFVLIEHQQVGLILFDCGFGSLSSLPSIPRSLFKNLYSYKPASESLKEAGIRPDEIQKIIISHFHFDHSGGLNEFDKAQIYTFKSAFHAIEKMNFVQALRYGVFKNQIPANFPSRVHFIDDKVSHNLPSEFRDFVLGYDLFGDGSIVAVDLSGHAQGQAGLIVDLGNGQNSALEKVHEKYFFVADTCYACHQLVGTNSLNKIISETTPNKFLYQRQIKRLRDLANSHKNVHILPSHCPTLPKRFPKLFSP